MTDPLAGIIATTDDAIAELVARFRTLPGFSWEPLRDDILTILKSRPAPAQGWQPIETAPTTPADADPEIITLWVVNGGDDGKGCPAFGRCYRSVDGTVRAVPNGYRGFKCSHWMPLPSPPSSLPSAVRQED